MSNEKDTPVIAGTERDEQSPQTMELIGVKDKTLIGVRRAPKSMGELVADLMFRTYDPELAQVFILDALEKYSAAAAELDEAQFDEASMGSVVKGSDWKRMGATLNKTIREHIDFVNSGGLGFVPQDEVLAPANDDNVVDAEIKENPTVNEYIERLKAHDWAGEMPEDLARMTRELDPTGEIKARFQPSTLH